MGPDAMILVFWMLNLKPTFSFSFTFIKRLFSSSLSAIRVVQFRSVTQSCPTLCDPMNHSTPGLPVQHPPPEFTQTHLHRVGDAIQPSHLLSPSSPPVLSLSQHQDFFQWIGFSHQVAKVLELQLQHQSFQWIFRVDFLSDWLVWSPCSARDSQEVFSSTTIQKNQFFGTRPSL